MLWNRRRALLLPLVVALGAAAAGCVEQPSITLHHAEVQGVSAFGVNLTVMLQVHNSNGYDVQVRRVNCNVTFGQRGAVLGPIDFSPNVWLRAGMTTLVAVPVSLPWTLVPALMAESNGQYGIPYQIHGVADVTATSSFNIQRNDYPIHDSGFVPRQTVVDATRGGMRLPF
jgi:hypothetical protein